MTQKHRDSLHPPDRRYIRKVGLDHVLDETPAERERDKDSGWIRKGLSGIFDIRRLRRFQSLDEEIEWHVANPDRPTSASPMNQALDFDRICRLAGLSGPQREAMVMWLEGDSLALIAEEIGINVPAVQHRLNWGRLKLKATFTLLQNPRHVRKEAQCGLDPRPPIPVRGIAPRRPRGGGQLGLRRCSRSGAQGAAHSPPRRSRCLDQQVGMVVPPLPHLGRRTTNHLGGFPCSS